MKEKHSELRREPSEMEFSATQEIIVQLKAIKETKHLSIPKIKEMVDATGIVLSETVYRRIFKDGSELNDSFNYEHTLRPIAQVLVPYAGDDDAAKASTKAFLAISEYKDEKIEELERQKENMREQFEKRCHEYETRMAFLRDQIELKDQRMDRKDAMIEKLLDQVLVCGKCVMRKDQQ